MKKLLMLGGSDIQVHAIRRARELGLWVITCDARPDNPGHRLADESHEVSTTDLDGVLDLARRRRVDGVLAYASDPAAPAASYVAEQLGLPGDPFDAVRTAQDKLLLRDLQQSAGLPTPEFIDASDNDGLHRLHSSSRLGIVVKPTDASGSKGVTRLSHTAAREEIARAVASAYEASRSKRAIAEQVWGVSREQFTADVLVWNGEVLYAAFGDQTMSPVPGSQIPIGVLCPTRQPRTLVAEAESQVAVLVSALGLRQGVYNAEFRTDEDGRLTIIDFGARIGGNLLGIVHQIVSGLDLVGSSLRIALGEAPPRPRPPQRKIIAGHLVIHSETDGALESIDLSRKLRGLASEVMISALPGDPVRAYRTSADRLGVIVLASDKRSLLESIYRDAAMHLGTRIGRVQ